MGVSASAWLLNPVAVLLCRSEDNEASFRAVTHTHVSKACARLIAERACVHLPQVFHFMQTQEHSGEAAQNEAFRRHPGAFHPVLQCFMSLDVLFLMCGFLAAITLVPALEDSRRTVKQACTPVLHWNVR